MILVLYLDPRLPPGPRGRVTRSCPPAGFRRKSRWQPQQQEPDGVPLPRDDNGKSAENQQSRISECYFTVKGAALVLPQNECIHMYRKNSTHGGDIQQHLQSMFYLLRPEDTLKMAVKLESIHAGRMRYLVVVSCLGHHTTEESCLLGVDCSEKATIGMVLPVWADTRITLDGDGGFSVGSSGRNHIFKPVSVQAMWSALQTLHKASAKARNYNYFTGGVTHIWSQYYEERIHSDRSRINEWDAMGDLESRRPPSPDSLRLRPTEKDATERYIRLKLKEIMMSVDLDEVTSKYIRCRLEEDLNMDLHEYKSFIDQEMIVILGQMDAATEIFDYLYLGSEWNASNLEELQRNGINQILNVTREIDNFFPGMFDYLNVRVYDEDGTELLKHWDKTYKFIEKAKKNHTKVLVHCKMGVSRSASVVIAYAMKAYDWNMQNAMEYVKNKRTCIKPNGGFLKQLETYEGILDASKQRHNTLWRSKSETNLKSPQQDLGTSSSEALTNPEPSTRESVFLDVAGTIHRPKSWSPEDNIANMLFPSHDTTDHYDPLVKKDDDDDGRMRSFTDPSVDTLVEAKNKHMLLPGRNGQSYSVSPNKVLHLPMTVEGKTNKLDDKVKFSIGDDEESPVYECRNPIYIEDLCDGDVLTEVTPLGRVSSVKDRINELESQLVVSDQKTGRDRLNLPELKGLVLNLANQFESASKSNTPSPMDEAQGSGSDSPPLFINQTAASSNAEDNDPVVSQTKPPAARHQAVLVKKETWPSEEKDASPLSGGWEQQQQGCLAQGSIEMVKQKDNLLMKVRVNNPNAAGGRGREPKQKDKALEADVRASATLPESAAGIPSLPAASTNESLFSAKKILKRDAILAQNDGLEGKNLQNLTRKDDPFSVQLDRVFDREERFQENRKAQVPSRQSSWGSCDSAIVIHAHERKESPSRQSSWGSVDGPCTTFLSRESSWGSADCRGMGHALASSSNFIRKSSIPDSQYSSPGTDFCPMPFASRTVAVSTATHDKGKNETDARNSSGTLKRTSSFDGSLATTLSNYDSFSTLNEQAVVSPIQRSHSLRTGEKVRSRFKLPSLKFHTPMPYKSPGEKDAAVPVPPTETKPACTKILHCASFPSLACKAEKCCHPCCHSLSHPNIGSHYPLICNKACSAGEKIRNLPCLNATSVACPSAATSCCRQPVASSCETKEVPFVSNVPLDGKDSSRIVQQQRQALEKKLATSPNVPNEGAASREQPPKAAQECVQALVPRTFPEVEKCSLGKVKQLTQKLESKTSPTALKSGNPVLVAEPQDTDLQKDGQQTIERSLSSPAVQSVNSSDPPSGSSDEKSVRSLVGKFELKETSRPRYHSENEIELRIVAVDADGATVPTSPVTPPGGVRKLSLEMENCTRAPVKSAGLLGLSHSPSFPAGRKDCLLELVQTNKNEERKLVVASVTNPTVIVATKDEGGKPVPSPFSSKSNGPTHSYKLKVSAAGLFQPAAKDIIPSPPTLPPPPLQLSAATTARKTRKLHGRSHPLNKLTAAKQRHSNPLYNTM